MERPRRLPLAVGGLISVALGLALATLTFGAVLILQGNPTEGGYCTKWGIGGERDLDQSGPVIYVSEGWSGFPPGERCSVYAVDFSRTDAPLVEGAMTEEQYRQGGLDEAPSRVLASGTYPGGGEYAWVLGALLLPPAIWALLTLASGHRSRRRP